MADSIPSLLRKNAELQSQVDDLRAELASLREELAKKPREVVREVDRATVVYQDNPDHIEMIRKLQAKIRELSA